jgi:hypothetical protein
VHVDRQRQRAHQPPPRGFDCGGLALERPRDLGSGHWNTPGPHRLIALGLLRNVFIVDFGCRLISLISCVPRCCPCAIGPSPPLVARAASFLSISSSKASVRRNFLSSIWRCRYKYSWESSFIFPLLGAVKSMRTFWSCKMSALRFEASANSFVAASWA